MPCARRTTLERLEALVARERPQVLGAAVRLGDGHVVLERRVRVLERVVELVALEDVVVGPRLVASLRCCGLTARPTAHTRAGLALDPDDDALLAPGVVDSVEHPLREPRRGRTRPARDRLYNRSDAEARSLRPEPVLVPLRARSSAEERVAAYVLREHGAGAASTRSSRIRTSRTASASSSSSECSTRPEVIHALGEQARRAARATLSAR